MTLPKKTGTLATTDDISTAVASKANDSDVVHKTGNETISGTKTFDDTIYSEYGFNAAHEDSTKEYGTEYSGEYIQTFIYGKGNNNEFKECYFMLPDKPSGDYYLATVDDIQSISGAENFVQIGTSSSSVDQTIYGTKTFNNTVYSNGNFNTTNSSSGSYASYGARTIALGTSSSPNIILNLPTTSGTHTLAIDDNVVHLNGTETITGAKTFKGNDLTFIYNPYSSTEWETIRLINSYNDPELKLTLGGGAGGYLEYTASSIKRTVPGGASGNTTYTLTIPTKSGTLACLYKHSISFNVPTGGNNEEDYYSFTIIAPIDTVANTKANLISLFNNAISVIDTSTYGWKKPVLA